MKRYNITFKMVDGIEINVVELASNIDDVITLNLEDNGGIKYYSYDNEMNSDRIYINPQNVLHISINEDPGYKLGGIDF